MRMYKVSMTVSAEQFMEIFPRIKNNVELEMVREIESEALHQDTDTPKRPGRRRGSKVHDTVLQALANGPQTVKQLKSALEGAGLAAGSLSTAIAHLQKAGSVARTADGVYDLRQAAQ